MRHPPTADRREGMADVAATGALVLVAGIIIAAVLDPIGFLLIVAGGALLSLGLAEAAR